MAAEHRRLGRFTGDTSAAGHLCEVQSSYAIEPGTGKLAIYFSMKNTGPPAATFTVVSNQYRPWDQGYPTAAGATSSDYFNAIAYDNGWYDFTVTLTSDSSWSRRFAGDLETEQPASPVDEPQQGFPWWERYFRSRPLDPMWVSGVEKKRPLCLCSAH